MSTRLYHSDFDARLRIVTREGDPSPYQVLKRVLKALLRTHGVRCLSIAETPTPDEVERRPVQCPDAADAILVPPRGIVGSSPPNWQK